MTSRATAEGRRLLPLAAACLLATLLLSPTVEASRGLPAALAPALASPSTPDQVLSAELEDPPERLRFFEDLRLPERPLELVEARKTASGVSTWNLGINRLQIGGLSQNRRGLSFQGLWTDPVTGIAYARNRWYDARTAIWLSEDPMGTVDSPNLYAFVGWGPHVGRDPMGAQTAFTYYLDEMGGLPPGSPRSTNFEQLQKGTAQLTLDTLANPYVQGSLQLAGGCTSAFFGALAAAAPEPGSTAVGVVAMAYGSDVCATGWRTIQAGEAQRTLTNVGMRKGLEAGGLDPNLADNFELLFGAVIDAGAVRYVLLAPASSLSRSGSISAERFPELTIYDEVDFPRGVYTDPTMEKYMPGGVEFRVFRADERLMVDMPRALPGQPQNAAGFARDASYYWDDVYERFPEAFSAHNRDILAGKIVNMQTGQVVTSPVYDETFRAVFPRYDIEGLRGAPMVHHHIGGGSVAVAVPAPLHPGSGGIHNVEKAVGIPPGW